MISQGVLGNLGVYLIHPPKMCAGLGVDIARSTRTRRGTPTSRAACTALCRSGVARASARTTPLAASRARFLSRADVSAALMLFDIVSICEYCHYCDTCFRDITTDCLARFAKTNHFQRCVLTKTFAPYHIF